MSCNQSADKISPLVSIVIPTKNRAKYAIWTIRTCLNLSDRCEVIVADSSSDSSLYDLIVSNNLMSRINYVKTGSDLTVVDNFNAGVSKVRAPYVTCIGDDDIVTSAIIEVAEFAHENKVECVNFTFPITYWWPDFIHRRRGKIDAATISIESYTSKLMVLDPHREMKDALKRFGSGPQRMPRIYAGLVSTDLIKRINTKYGALFGGVSPDVFSSTLLAGECKSFIMLDHPVIVPGVSGSSTSGASSNGKHIGKLRQNDHISPFKNLIWDARVPEFYSVPTVWSYSMLKALEKMGIDYKANFGSAYLKCFLYHREYFEETLHSVRFFLKSRSFFRLCFDFLIASVNEIEYIVRAVYRRVSERFYYANFKRLGGCENSFQAALRIEEVVDKPYLKSIRS